jgi:hypothetical protein
MNDLRTVPDLAREWGVSLDALRECIRKSEDLRRLGSRIGPTRVYEKADAAMIRTAFAEKRKRVTARAAC